AVVEGQRGQAAVVQPFRVRAEDLFLHPGERSGQDDGGRPVGGNPEVAGQGEAVGGEGDVFGGHAAIAPAPGAAPRPIIHVNGARGRKRVITVVSSSRWASVTVGAPPVRRLIVSRYIIRYRR